MLRRFHIVHLYELINSIAYKLLSLNQVNKKSFEIKKYPLMYHLEY